MTLEEEMVVMRHILTQLLGEIIELNDELEGAETYKNGRYKVGYCMWARPSDEIKKR